MRLASLLTTRGIEDLDMSRMERLLGGFHKKYAGSIELQDRSMLARDRDVIYNRVLRGRNDPIYIVPGSQVH